MGTNFSVVFAAINIMVCIKGDLINNISFFKDLPIPRYQLKGHIDLI